MATKKQSKPKQDDHAAALLKQGTVTITAQSREEIYALAEQLTSQLADVEWTRGMVEHCSGSFTQKYSLVKK